MSNSESMRELRNRVGNDADSVAALKRGVWERVLAKGNKGIAEFTGSEEGRRVLNIVYQGDQTHLKNIKTILDANETLGRSRPAAGSAEKAVTPDSWARENLGQSVPSLINAGNSALVTERASKAWTAATLFTRFANSYTQRQADDALKAALFDPKVAEQLASAVRTSRFTPMQQKAISSYLMMMPNTVSKDDVQDTQPIDVKGEKRQPLELTVRGKKGAQQ
jgi:hypothetical protein